MGEEKEERNQISPKLSIQPALHQPQQQQQQRRDRDLRESLGQTGRLVLSHVGKDFKREPELGSAPDGSPAMHQRVLPRGAGVQVKKHEVAKSLPAVPEFKSKKNKKKKRAQIFTKKKKKKKKKKKS